MLDDPELVLTGKSARSWVRVHTGADTGTAKDTQGLCHSLPMLSMA